MSERVEANGLQVASELYSFINEEALPGTGIAPDDFWSSFAKIVADLSPRNTALLALREQLQSQIDAWHEAHKDQPLDLEAYKQFLDKIGYLVPEGAAFSVATAGVDPEISEIAGPQLVVPVMNARYSLNAANARWGSLYDALYGTDVIAETGGVERGRSYNPVRGQKVIAFARGVLDEAAPLGGASWRDATGVSVEGGTLGVATKSGTVGLKDASQLVGYDGTEQAPNAVLLRHNGLHLEIVIDREHSIGKDDPAGIADIIVEAAMTTIIDLEDSIAAVDAEDKVAAYRNWLGLMKGDLTATFEKGGKTVDRALNADRTYKTPRGGTLTLTGLSLMLVRNVGHQRCTPCTTTRWTSPSGSRSSDRASGPRSTTS